MNICPVLRPVDTTTKGVISGADDQDVELMGLGRFGLGKRLLRLSPERRLAMLARRRGGRRRGRYLSMPTRFAVQLHGFDGPYDDDGEGLGKLRRRRGGMFGKIGKGLRKVVKSKLFKYAAIGTAAYFTGGAALKLAAKPGVAAMFKRLRKSKTLRQVGPGLVAAQQGFPDTGEGQMYPEASYAGGGGGGGFSVPSSEVETPTTDETAPAEMSMMPGLGGGGGLLLLGLGAVALFASSPRGGRRRRRR